MSDQHLIPSYKITPKSNIKSGHNNQRNDHKLRSSWMLNKFSMSASSEMYGEQYEEYAYWYKGVKD